MHVDDHAAGVEAALLRGESGEIYNLAPKLTSEAFTEEVIDRVRDLVGKGNVKKVGDRDHYDLRYWMSASKAKRVLGWEAEHDLAQTLYSTVSWYLENPKWLEAANERLANSTRRSTGT